MKAYKIRAVQLLTPVKFKSSLISFANPKRKLDEALDFCTTLQPNTISCYEADYIPIMPGFIPPPAGASSFSGTSTTNAPIVILVPAIEAAF